MGFWVIPRGGAAINPIEILSALNRLSRTGIADEMREEHRRRVLIRCYAFRNSSGRLATFAAIGHALAGCTPGVASIKQQF